MGLPKDAIFRGPLLHSNVEMLALSYCWGNFHHPDEFGFQIRDLARLVGWFINKEAQREHDARARRRGGTSYQAKQIIVFMDWAAFHQHGCDYQPATVREVGQGSYDLSFENVSDSVTSVSANLIREMATVGSKPELDVGTNVSARVPRTHEEQDVFVDGLKSVNLWYANQHVRKVLLTKLPERCIDRRPYIESGWPCFEKAASSMITDSEYILDASQLKGADLESCP